MSNNVVVQFVLQSAERYCAEATKDALIDLPIPTTSKPFDWPLVRICLPDWAADIGVGQPSHLMVPAFCVTGEGADWECCDWWRACFSFLTCEAERHYEQRMGPCHSYAYRLPKTLTSLWDHAWVNRILLFLRRWAAWKAGRNEADMFGALRGAEILLTHDVDALQKTLPIRIKALAFDGFNALKLARQGALRDAVKRLVKGIGFFLRPADYNYLAYIAALEQSFGQVSTFNFHGGKSRRIRGPKRYLMDPGYDVTSSSIAHELRKLAANGFTIGVHPSFDVFADAEQLRAEMDRIRSATGLSVVEIRQHWLRFSWADTWRAQEKAGLLRDTTLGFNDRPGFRNGAAMCIPAWIAPEKRASDHLRSIPMILMDSHLFDYHVSDEQTRRATIDRWLDEVKAVHGIATVVWHQRVFHPKDYGWGDDYTYLLSRLPGSKEDL